ncbi:MAG: HNH endonuclease [Chloroflexi bacterium]|nr:HNH endonuclease [Chloroflexota bacterium]|tara:strand:+ start:638 stop:1453 length:816 start_codon:yes stop_codon:yes gene_type:complete
MFVKGQVYRRRNLHSTYGGNWQSGITPSSSNPLIFLFSGQSGEQYGYTDGWKDGVFLYAGEGQVGNQEFIRGNRAIRDHVDNRKDLHLFLDVGDAQVQYESAMVCIGHDYSQTRDRDGNLRRIIIFQLIPLDDSIDPSYEENSSESAIDATSASQLRDRASKTETGGTASVRDRQVTVYSRSKAVKDYIAVRANGHCEGCGVAAPFITVKGRPYIEPHHIHRLSDGGPDHPRWVVGLCPNCHRRAHYSSDANEYNNQLDAKVKALEDALGP